eukprot:4092369-Amphidinium_carterae.1
MPSLSVLPGSRTPSLPAIVPPRAACRSRSSSPDRFNGSLDKTDLASRSTLYTSTDRLVQGLSQSADWENFRCEDEIPVNNYHTSRQYKKANPLLRLNKQQL